MLRIRPEQYAALRRKRIGDDLIASYSSTVLKGRWDETKTTVLLEDPLTNRITIGFDSMGFVDRVQTPLGRMWQTTNLPDGKRAQVVAPSGHVGRMGYGAGGRLAYLATSVKQPVQLHYTMQGKLAGASFVDGTWESIEYAPWGSVQRMVDRLGAATSYEYDTRRRVTAIADGNGKKTEFVYSGWSRPISTSFANGTSERYAYDAEGKITGIAQGDVIVRVKTNDKGRPVELRYSDGAEIQYAYDDKGRIVEASLGDLTSKLAWNEQGFVTEDVSEDLTNTFAFDECGRVSQLTLSTGESVAYRWDADSRLVNVVDWDGGEHTIEHAANDGGYVTRSPNGTSTFTRVDAGGSAVAIDVVSQWASLFSLAYGYDGEGRVATMRDRAFGDRNYSYDAEGQLLSAEGEKGQRGERFAYDRNGNPTQFGGALVRVDDANQMVAAGDEELQYDARGNLIRRSGSRGTWQHTYDGRNLMVSSTAPSGERTLYAYDGFGRRIRKRTGDRETRFFWVCEQLTGEVTVDRKTGASTRQDYLYLPGSYTPIATRIDGTVYSYHVDHAGTPRAMTGPDGSLVWLASYSAFGNATVTLAKVRNPLRFAGQYFDEETGLHYNRFRYYSPALGRYMSRDPYGFLTGTNFYTYAGNNPINRTDPLGLISWDGVENGLIAAAVGVAVVAAVVATCGAAAAPLAIVGAGLLAGGIAGGLNEYDNEKNQSKDPCMTCIAKAASLGALVGAVAALPVAYGAAYGVAASLFGGEALGTGAIAGLGGASGAISYVGGWMTSDSPWSTTDFLATAGIGAVTAGVGSKVPAVDGALGAEGAEGVVSNPANSAASGGITGPPGGSQAQPSPDQNRADPNEYAYPGSSL
jgi:RHS repeat-associated protein